MRTFDDLVREAEEVPIDGWDFGWLDGRAVEARPSWHYFDRVVERVDGVPSVLEVQAGTGGMLGTLPRLPPLAVATEGHPPNVKVAASVLRNTGARLVVTSQDRVGLPFADRTFDLVISRHPVTVWWEEIARVLRPGGLYFAQHVGPHSLRTLTELLMGPVSESSPRAVEVERRAARASGLIVERMTLERPRVAFFDVGAVVYFLRVVPWIVPGFDVAAYRDRLHALHEMIERDTAFETTSSRVLVEARRPVTADPS